MVFAEDPPTDRWPDENGRASAQTGAHAAHKDAQGADSLPFVWAKDIPATEEGAGEILEDILTEGAMSVWYGESNSGKTYLVLDLARAMSLGSPWLGHRTVQGCVIYVAAEGSKTIERRIRAIRTIEGDIDFPLGVVKTGLDMCHSSGDTEALAALVNAKAKEFNLRPSLVIVDTLSRVLAGGNENDSVDMGALVKNGDLLRELTGAHVAWVHHTGKDIARGARGHSLLRAGTDTEIEITHDGASGLRCAKITKQRDLSSNGIQLYGKLEPVELGTNQWGNTITACVVIPVEALDAPRPRTKQLSEIADRAVRIAREVSKSCGLTVQTSAVPGGKQLIDYDAWRDEFIRSCGPIEPATARKAWSRVNVTLREALVTGSYDGQIWLW